jgi:hypothetical protein
VRVTLPACPVTVDGKVGPAVVMTTKPIAAPGSTVIRSAVLARLMVMVSPAAFLLADVGVGAVVLPAVAP